MKHQVEEFIVFKREYGELVQLSIWFETYEQAVDYAGRIADERLIILGTITPAKQEKI